MTPKAAFVRSLHLFHAEEKTFGWHRAIVVIWHQPKQKKRRRTRAVAGQRVRRRLLVGVDGPASGNPCGVSGTRQGVEAPVVQPSLEASEESLRSLVGAGDGAVVKVEGRHVHRVPGRVCMRKQYRSHCGGRGQEGRTPEGPRPVVQES